MNKPQRMTENARKTRILSADDDPIIRELMQVQVASGTTEVVVVDNGDDAWDRLSSEVFDLAIVDLSMPGLNGIELIRHLRQTPRTVDLPVIVATSRGDSDAIERTFAAGATSFVTKPINWALFGHQIRFVLRNGTTERALRQARAAEEVASQTKDTLFRLLAHEFRTPLNSIIGFSGLLEQNLGGQIDENDARGYLADIAEAASRLNNVVGDVLSFSRMLGGDTTMKCEVVSVDELLANCEVKYKAAAKAKDVHIVRRKMPEPVFISADERLLSDALYRLMDNAVKFSLPGGTVEVLAYMQEDASLAISFRDNGPGMDSEQTRQCLKPFHQADMTLGRAADGLGLGLAIARRAAEMHSGKILIRSEAGEGTVAALLLPNSAICAHNHGLTG